MLNFTEQELKEFAKEQAKTITIRIYIDGNSKDITRNTSKPEAKIIETIIYGGLLAIRDNGDVRSIIDACEYIAKLQIPEMNGYHSIYLPMMTWCKSV